jgi:membrane associated rhomboid family serine protease
MALVVGGAGVWLALRGAFLHEHQIAVEGPLQGQWWRLFSTQFAYGSGYGSGVYAFVVLAAVALFGSLLERRHGPVTVLVVFFGCGVSGVLVALALYPAPLVLGANGGALGLLAAWSVADLRAARSHTYYEGDLLGTAAFAAALLAIPFALQRPEASWAAGVTGGLVGLVLGFGLNQVSSADSA